MMKNTWMMKPIAVDEIPTNLLVAFIQQHQQRLSELQDELQLRHKLQAINEDVENVCSEALRSG
jgi:hypothetical protein